MSAFPPGSTRSLIRTWRLSGCAPKFGIRPKVAYTLSDMADDAAGVLDALGIEAAHVVGVSMGGMISQRLATEHPDRVLSLCSIMSSPGQPVGSVGLTMKLMRMEQNPDSREGRIGVGMETFRLIAGNGFDLDEDLLLEWPPPPLTGRGTRWGPTVRWRRSWPTATADLHLPA